MPHEPDLTRLHALPLDKEHASAEATAVIDKGEDGAVGKGAAVDVVEGVVK